MSVLLFLVSVPEKGKKSSKFRLFRGPFAAAEGPLAAAKAHAKAWHAMSRRYRMGGWLSLEFSFAVAKPLFIAWKIVVFQFCFVFRCSKDSSIRQMRTL